MGKKNYDNQFHSLLDTATWPCQVKEYKIVLEPSLLTGWLCCQPRFQFHEVKAAGCLLDDERHTARIVNEAALRPSFPSQSAKTTTSIPGP